MRLITSLLLMLSLFKPGQNSINGWKSHIPFTPVIHLAETSCSDVTATRNRFLFTDSQGMISYISHATSGEPTPNNMYVWPNPLLESYNGGVTVDKLAEGYSIKNY